jgi:cytochrome c553
VTTWATAQDVERAANNWSDGQVACRAYGHQWRPLTARHRPGVYTILQRCGRCHNERQQQINESGYPITGWYISYQDNYLLKKLGRVGVDGRAVLRLVTLRNLYIEEEPAA